MSNEEKPTHRVITIQMIDKCSKKSIAAGDWIPVHDCGDPDCPMRGK